MICKSIAHRKNLALVFQSESTRQGKQKEGLDKSNLDVGKGAMRQRLVERGVEGCDVVARHGRRIGA